MIESDLEFLGSYDVGDGTVLRTYRDAESVQLPWTHVDDLLTFLSFPIEHRERWHQLLPVFSPHAFRRTEDGLAMAWNAADEMVSTSIALGYVDADRAGLWLHATLSALYLTSPDPDDEAVVAAHVAEARDRSFAIAQAGLSKRIGGLN